MNVYKLTTNGKMFLINAQTAISAVLYYCLMHEKNFSDFELTDDLVVIPKNEWNKYFVSDKEGKPTQKTVAEQMILRIQSTYIISEFY